MIKKITFQLIIWFALTSCTSTPVTMVNETSLQHHRWVLESVNGELVNAEDLDNVIPEIEFGEQMTVSGNAGCNRFSGKAELQNDQIILGPIASTRMLCSPAQNQLEILFLQLLGENPTISLDASKNLTLKAGDTSLEFQLKDWVQ